ncbi:Epithelial splicing regulatory protein 1 [Frankliniella fusca]|uniref:Epithelial splicing regulatory protein 1 n=1 Tax=Frankliniella fusca TaxID=407009 RepID=A0AAE1HUP7_9NEOP|nr:Epithelial splicing regulatory protein 1 [Frankliniella fusca]
MKGTRYLCVLYVATAGQQGARLGSDEEEIVLLIYIVIDVAANKVSPSPCLFRKLAVTYKEWLQPGKGQRPVRGQAGRAACRPGPAPGSGV